MVESGDSVKKATKKKAKKRTSKEKEKIMYREIQKATEKGNFLCQHGSCLKAKGKGSPFLTWDLWIKHKQETGHGY